MPHVKCSVPNARVSSEGEILKVYMEGRALWVYVRGSPSGMRKGVAPWYAQGGHPLVCVRGSPSGYA